MKVKDYIATRVERHRVLADKLYEDTRNMVENPACATALMRHYAAPVAGQMLNDFINDDIAKANALDVLHNAEVKKCIKDARKASLPDALKNREVPADYQLQISNALTFITLAGRNLTDAEAFSIIKPFFNDFEQMKRFEQAIIHLSPEYNHTNVRKYFPNTLGGILNIADEYNAVFDEAETLAEVIFLGEKQPTKYSTVGDVTVSGAIVADTYEQLAAQDRLLELAGMIDSFVATGSFEQKPKLVPFGESGLSGYDGVPAEPSSGSGGTKDDDALFNWDSGADDADGTGNAEGGDDDTGTDTDEE